MFRAAASQLMAGTGHVGSAVCGWGVLFLVSCVLSTISDRSVTPIYRQAALNWSMGNDLYDRMDVTGFSYLPQAAIIYSPFARLPADLEGPLWRACNMALFAIGACAISRLAARGTGFEFFPLVTLVTIPLAFDNARNGQATLAMAGLMMLATAHAAEQRWWRSAIMLAAAVAVKPIAIVLLLLFGALYRPLSWRLSAATTALLLIPFLRHDPAYAASQYAAFWDNTIQASHAGSVLLPFAHVFGMISSLGGNVDAEIQTAVRLVCAPVTLALCWIPMRRLNAQWGALLAYSLGACYLMLFSPRTENCTYAMMGPVFGVFTCYELFVRQERFTGLFLMALSAGTAGSHELGRLIHPGRPAVWLAPLMCLFFTGYLLLRLTSFGSPRNRLQVNQPDQLQGRRIATRAAGRPVDGGLRLSRGRSAVGRRGRV